MNEHPKPIDENEHTFQTIKAKPVTLSDNYPFFNRRLWYRVVSKIGVGLIKVFSLWLYAYPILGFRVYGKENYKKVKKQGAIIIANHIHPIDAFMLCSKFYPDRFFVLMLQTNLGIPLAGKFMRLMGGIPIPQTKQGLMNFNDQMTDTLQRNAKILVYPEASLRPYCTHIRPFKRGAFRFAYKTDVPILPMVFTFHEPKGIQRLVRKKPVIHLHVLPAHYVEEQNTKAETLEFLKQTLHHEMKTFFNTHSEIKDGGE